jgi:hypothetical protein
MIYAVKHQPQANPFEQQILKTEPKPVLKANEDSHYQTNCADLKNPVHNCDRHK